MSGASIRRAGLGALVFCMSLACGGALAQQGASTASPPPLATVGLLPAARLATMSPIG